MKFARFVFTIAGIYGLVILGPYYFMEQRIGREYPPAITHPEFFYGFVGLALMWQVAFLVIARDPIRFRPFMWLGVGEKLSFFGACVVLFLQGRLPGLVVAFGLVDFTLGVLFAVAWFRTGGGGT